MPTRTIDTVLFDADGVFQRSTIDWRATLAGFIGPLGPAGAEVVADPDAAVTRGAGSRREDDFILDLMTSERPALVGKRELADGVAEVLRRWGSTTPLDEVLQVWNGFEADPEVVAVIGDLRAAGVRCHLATNQHAYRRRIMHDERHYGDWFDQTFYSSDLGVAKPDPAYFRAILDAVGRPANAVLFIDDNEANVASARTVGLHAEQYDLELGISVLRDLLRSYGLPLTD